MNYQANKDSWLSMLQHKIWPERAASKSSASTEAATQQALDFISQGKLGDAEAIYEELISTGSQNHKTWGNLAAIRGMQGRLGEMIELLKTALALEPNYPEALNNLGHALRLNGNLDGAIESFGKALKLRPDFPDACHNLGIALQAKGDLIAALSAYNNALAIKPDYPEAGWNSSLIMLLMGDYKQGWERYEWRTKREGRTSTPHALPKCRQWKGTPGTVPKSKLLLVTEQGFGDTLQFMRYATTLRKQGIPISFCAQPKLHSLIKASGVDPSPLTPEQANEVTEGQWLQLLSVPRYLGVNPDNPILSAPYIHTSSELNAKWSRVLGAENAPIIGLNWQGNPETEKEGLKGRSLHLETFAPIARGNNISLLSLQKGYGSEQLENCSFKERFVDCQDQINEAWDFLETAAIIANCDLVITNDTAVAHLAGGMGKTTWLLLHDMPDWRWGLHSENSFWYPTMRLFRQRPGDNWHQVVERVAKELHKCYADCFNEHTAPG